MSRPSVGRRPRAIAATVLAAAVLVACERPPATPLVYSETIGSLGKDYRGRSLVVSHDHRHLAWVEERDDRCRVVLDGKKGPLLWRCIDPHLARDGAALAYWAGPELTNPPRGHLYVNQEPTPPLVGQDGPIALSRTGGGWAAIAPAFDPAAPPWTEEGVPPTPAPGAEEKPPAERHLIAFGSLGLLGDHHDTTAPAVSRDGRHIAYIAADADDQRRLIVDGEEVRRFGRPEVPYLPVVKPARPGPNLEPESTVRYLADGSLVAVGLAEQGWSVFHEDQVWATYPAVKLVNTGIEVIDPRFFSAPAMLAGSIATATQAPVACWWERLEGEAPHWRVACNGRPIDDQVCDNYWSDQPISVAADGRSAGYVCPGTPPLQPDGVPSGLPPLYVVVNGAKLGPHAFVWGIDVSADGKHYAYAAADSIDDSWYYVVDGRRYDGPWRQAFPPRISPDGSSVAWAANRHEEGAERVDLVVNGDLVARADVVMAPPIFEGERKVQWAIRRGNSIRRLVVCTRWAPLEILRPLVCRSSWLAGIQE